MKEVQSLRLEPETIEYYVELAAKNKHLGARFTALMAHDLEQAVKQRKQKEGKAL
jgi:hypothetical protein